MGGFCERLSEQLALVAQISPQAGATAAVTTDIFSMAMHRRALFILSHGAGTGGILCNIQENAALAFTAGTATVLTRAAVDCDVVDTQYLFEVSAEAMTAGMEFLRGVFTPVDTDLLSVVVLADVERYGPASDRDLVSVASIQVAN